MIQTIQTAHDNSMPNISLIDCEIDSISYENKSKLLELIEKKLRHGGRLSILGVDALEISRGFYKGYLSLEEFNSFLKPSLSTIDEIVNGLESLGLKIVVKRINNYKYYVEAVRT